MSGASLEVFVPFSVHWPRSRLHCLGAADSPAIPLRRSVMAGPRSAICGPADLTPTLRVFASAHLGPTDTSRWSSRGGPTCRALGPNSSLTFYPVPALALRRASRGDFRTWRRLDGPVARGAVRRSTVVRGCGRCNRFRHARRRSDHSSAFATCPVRSSPGSFAKRAFFAWRSATRTTAARPGRTTQVFPRSSPDGAHGVPCTLRRFDPSAGWTFRSLARRKRRG